MPVFRMLPASCGESFVPQSVRRNRSSFASVAINWLPNIFARLQRDYPGIEYEMLLGDYAEIEGWIEEGRVDCGFLRLPTRTGFDTVLLKQDEYKVVLPEGHALAEKETIAAEDLNGLPFREQ